MFGFAPAEAHGRLVPFAVLAGTRGTIFTGVAVRLAGDLRVFVKTLPFFVAKVVRACGDVLAVGGALLLATEFTQRTHAPSSVAAFMSAHSKTPYITPSMDFPSGKGVVWG